jgi:hypothetical protein
MSKKAIAFCALVAAAIPSNVGASRIERHAPLNHNKGQIMSYIPKHTNHQLARAACQPPELEQIKSGEIAHGIFYLGDESAKIANLLRRERKAIMSILRRCDADRLRGRDANLQNLEKRITRQSAAIVRQYANLQTRYQLSGHDLG